MGLYYPAALVSLGAAQPLTPKELTPPSGPPPSNPVFGAAGLAATLVAAWTTVAWPMSLPPGLVASAPAPQAPPINGGAILPEAVLTAWLPPPPQPIVAVNLDPPITGPAISNPPVNGGASISEAVLATWLPAPGIPQRSPGLIPAPLAAAWLPAPLQMVIAWPEDAPWVPPPAQLIISGPAPSNPPVRLQTTPSEVLLGWLPPSPQPPVAAFTPLGAPPAAGPPPPVQTPLAVFASWSASQWPPQQSPGLIMSAPGAGPPPVQTPLAVFAAWGTPALSLPSRPVVIPLSGPAVSNPPVQLQSTPIEVLLSWAPAPPWLPQQTFITASGPAPPPPPIVAELRLKGEIDAGPYLKGEIDQ